MSNLKIGDKVKVISGGAGAYCANGFIGNIISRRDANKYMNTYNLEYHGESRYITAPVYVANETKCYGLAVGFEIETIEENFILPEKWCVKVTKENIRQLENWSKWDLSHGSGYIRSDNNNSWFPIIPLGFTEITYEQLKKYVLKEKNMKTQEISRKCLGEFYNVVCRDWQDRIEELIGGQNQFNDVIAVPEGLLKDAYSAADGHQTILLDKYFERPKRKVIKTAERWVNVHIQGGVFDHQSYSSENAAKNATKDLSDATSIIQVKLTGTYEVEE